MASHRHSPPSCRMVRRCVLLTGGALALLVAAVSAPLGERHSADVEVPAARSSVPASPADPAVATAAGQISTLAYAIDLDVLDGAAVGSDRLGRWYVPYDRGPCDPESGASSPCVVPSPSPSDMVRSNDPLSPTKAFDDVAYGDHPEQTLDVYLPERGAGHGGAIIWIHGGAWQSASEELAPPYNAIVRNLGAEYGWAIFSIRMRTLEFGPFPVLAQDVNRAIRWVKAHAADYDIDVDKVVVAGWSSGGHLAVLAATGWNVAEFQPDDLPDDLQTVSPRPAATISIAGTLDPREWADDKPYDNPFTGAPAVAVMAGCPSATDPRTCTAEQLDAIDVSTYADASDPPVYIAHGDSDGIVVGYRQHPVMLRLASVLGSGRVWYDTANTGPYSERNHAPDFAMNRAAVVQFLGYVLDGTWRADP